MNNSKEKKIKIKVISGLAWTFFERTASQGITLILSVILARILEPEDYGVITIVMVFISIADVFITSGLSNALIQKKDADDLDFSSVFYSNIALSSILYLILFLASPYIAKYYSLPDLNIIIRVLCLYIPIIGFNAVQNAFVSKYMMFKKFFISTLSGTIISAIIGIVMAYLDFGVWSLVTQRLCNALINTFVLWRIVDWRPKLKYSFKRMKGIISYSWKLLVSSMISTFSEDLRSLIIGKKFSSNQLAFYSQGSTYPRQIVTNINNTISRVMFPTLSEYQDDLIKTKQIMRRAIKTGIFIMSPMLVGLSVIADSFVKILLTEKWIEIVPYIQIFSIYYIFAPIHTINLQAIKAIGRSDLFLKLEIIKRIYSIIILLITVLFFDSVFIIAIGMLIQTLISCFVNAAPNKKILNYGYIEQIIDIAPSLFISIIMGACVYAVKYIELGLLYTIILQVITGVIVYIILSKTFKLESYIYIRNIIITIIGNLFARRENNK